MGGGLITCRPWGGVSTRSISYARKLGDQPLLLAIASFKAHQVGEHEMPARRVVELYPEKQSKRRDM